MESCHKAYLLAVLFDVFEGLGVVHGKDAQKSFARPHVLIAHSTEIPFIPFLQEQLLKRDDDYDDDAYLYSSCPAVSSISRRQVSPSTTTCLRYESSIVGSYSSMKLQERICKLGPTNVKSSRSSRYLLVLDELNRQSRLSDAASLTEITMTHKHISIELVKENENKMM